LSWQRLRGHDSIIEHFAQAVSHDRLAHAYLFTGPPGIGKRLFAHELARALLCENPTPGKLEACDHCPACIQVEARTHPDYFSTGRPADSPKIPIGVIRELCHDLSLKPARGRGKVAIVDDADDFNDPITHHAAANAFLKTLEEPPPGSVLILISTNPAQQLRTIVSRCQVVRFAPLPVALVDELLQQQGVTDDGLRQRLLRLAEGSPGQAMALADPALWDFRRTLLQGLTRTPVESVRLAKEWIAFVKEAGKESAPQRQRAKVVVRLLVDFLSDALSLCHGGPVRRTEPDDRPLLTALMQRTGPDLLLELLERCLEADRQIDRRVQQELILEALMDTFAQRMR